MDGGELLARWREAGEWWTGEPPLEFTSYIDSQGRRRETWRKLSDESWNLAGHEDMPPEDLREEIDVRLRKRRDEKVAKACGAFSETALPSFSPTDRPLALFHVVSGYSFGQSALIAEEAPAHAAMRGYTSALIADRFSLAGVREFAQTAQKVGIRPLLGATIEMEDGAEIVLVAKNATGYRSLSRLITTCHLEEPRGFPLANWERLQQYTEGLAALTGGDSGPIDRALVKGDEDAALATLGKLMDLYGRDSVFIQWDKSFHPWELSVHRRLQNLARKMGLTEIAGGPTTHLDRSHFPAQDVLQCVEALCLVDEVEGRKPRRGPGQPAGTHPPRRAFNGERYMRSAAETQFLFQSRPELLDNGQKLLELCDESILPGMSELPGLGGDEIQSLREKTFQGALHRYNTLSPALDKRIHRELDRIARLGFSGHFLIAADMCDWAESQNILFSGRGSVIDSVVAYCLGFSRIDAHRHRLHFDRFLPEDGAKRPDIDIDFEAARRNDVRQYLVQKYGQEHVATVGAFGAYRSRGIIRAVAKTLGIPDQLIGFLTKRVHGGVSPERLRQAVRERPELREGGIPLERFEWVFKLANTLMDVPMNIRSHSSGVIVSRTPIRDVVPVMLSADEDVRIIQWDKRSAKKSFDKFDILCLRGNDVLSGTQTRLREHINGFDVRDISLDDAETYRTMRNGHLIGIPQSASPAMRQAHIRLKTQNLDDASLVQAGIRPGVGGAVKMNELIARRRGKPYSFSHPEFEPILAHTYGIIVFQEQVDQLLQTFGGYSSDEAETVREGIHKKRKENYVAAIRDDVIRRVMERGYAQEVAHDVYDLVSVFQGYGFAQGHALAFAEISIRSVWCQQNYPAEYFAALLDAQPAGYYGPCTLANEARTRGVKILRPDVNQSQLGFSVEDIRADSDPKIMIPSGGIRVALRQIEGVSKGCIEALVLEREKAPFESFFDFVGRVRPARDELEWFIQAGAFDGFCENRRALLWSIPAACDYARSVHTEGGLALGYAEPEIPVQAPDFSQMERAIRQRRSLGMDVSCHLMAYEREKVTAKGGLDGVAILRLAPGQKGFVVGNPIRLRFPPTPSGRRVMFFDLEDETGILNVTGFDEFYQRYGHNVICRPYVTLFGEVQDRDGHLAFLASRAIPYHPKWTDPDLLDPSFSLPITTADFLVG